MSIFSEKIDLGKDEPGELRRTAYAVRKITNDFALLSIDEPLEPPFCLIGLYIYKWYKIGRVIVPRIIQGIQRIGLYRGAFSGSRFVRPDFRTNRPKSLDIFVNRLKNMPFHAGSRAVRFCSC